MLYRELLTSELHKQREDFRRYALEQSTDLEFYFDALKKLEKENFAELEKKLFAHDNAGAIPANEIEIN